MKQRIFYCGWNDYSPWADKSMNSERAYKLMRAWRRRSRQASNRPKLIFQRIGKHEYRVCDPSYPNEWHVMKWGEA